jgi:hypothetical protein
MAERKIDYRDTLSRIDILPKKPRGAGIGKFGGDKQMNFLPANATKEEQP